LRVGERMKENLSPFEPENANWKKLLMAEI
jgi:hypothetical protein